MTGTTIAQAIPIAISPILTRIYTPKDFGIFTLYMSIASIIAVIATGRYELAIMLPKKDEDAINIVAISIIIAFIISFLSLIIVFIFNAEITNFLGNPEISNWLYFIPITVLLTGIYQSFNYWLNRKNQYKTLAIGRIMQSTAAASTNLTMGFNSFGSSGLILGGVLGQGVATGILVRMLWKEDSHRINQIKKMKIFALIKKYIEFPKINLFHAFINDAKNFIVNLLLVRYYDAFLLGQFYIINRVLLLPVGLIGGSISQVLFRVYSKKYNEKQNFSKDVLGMMLKLFLFGLIPFSVILFFGTDVFKFVFGENWGVAGNLASAYALYVLFHFIASPISIIPLIVKKQLEAFYWNLGGAFIYVASIIVGYLLFEKFDDVLLFLSIMMSIYFLFCFKWIYNISIPTQENIYYGQQ